MSDTALEKLDAASQMLSEIKTVDDAMKIADVAAAAAVYAKRAGHALPVINRAVFIKVAAERAAGKLLAKMDKAKNRHSSGSTLPQLGINRTQSSRWQRMALVPEKEVGEYFETCDKGGREAASTAIEKKGRAANPKNGAKPAERTNGFVTELDGLVKSGQKFGTIYADPPWLYSNQGTRAATGNHYSGLTVDEMCKMPVGQLAAEKSHLHLWTTNAFLFECPMLFAAWGFEFKSSFVWVKKQMGIGNYWRNSHEIMLLAVKGGQVGISKGEMSWLECSRGAHSAKPDAVRGRIERLSPGPFLELFGRRPVDGWTVFGNQILDML